MKFKEFNFNRGWKILVYFDIVLPAILFLIAYLTSSPMLATLFHSYEIFVISPIPNFVAYTGIIGFLFHAGVIAYTIIKKNYRDMLLCIVITLMIAAFFYFEINYQLIRPLTFYR